MMYIGFGSIGMDLGSLLLLISIVAFILDALFVISGKYFEKWEFFSELSLIVGGSTLIVSFLYFSYSILSTDYSFAYVSSYVNNRMDLILRISVIWSGQSGSYFLWVFLAAIIYLIYRYLFRNYAHETVIWGSFVLIATQLAILTTLTTMNDPFRLNTFIPDDGIGIDPVLMTVWNVIHPPIIFIGYALCLFPMAIGILRISVLEEGKLPSFAGKEKLDKFNEFIISFAWLFLSSGIIIGAYWSYITLGWGGFWAWDPVETASLVPWLFCTLYYHGTYFHRKSKYLGNYIMSMPYFGALFATYLTRSAIISSVHAFQPERTLEKILSAFIPKDTFIVSIILRFIPDERLLLLFVLMATIFVTPLILGIKNRELKRIPITLHKKDFQAAKSRNTALKITYITSLFGTFVMILGLIAPVIYDIIGYLVTFSPRGFGSTFTIDSLFYNTMLTIFGGILLLAQFFCTFYPRLSVKRKFGLVIFGATAGVVFAVSGFFYRNGSLTSILGQENPILSFFRNLWTTSDKANLVIPIILLGMIGLASEFIITTLKEEKHLIRKTSQIMLHFSFLVMILGAVTSANMTISNELMVQEDFEYEIPGTSFTIKILDLKRTYPESGQHAVEYDTSFMITTGMRIIGIGISRLAYDQLNRLDQKVTIISEMFADIYIVTYNVFEEGLTGLFVASTINIKVVPYINILWTGSLLLHFAIIPLAFRRFILFKEALSKEKKKDKINSNTASSKSKEEIAEINDDPNG